jgi:anaerobic magnesium-protoporphyrin IX monomethyl ester cyclase
VRVALVNPPWRYDHSIYFGCREPHLPLELAYAKALLERHGHETLMLDGHLWDSAAASLADEVAAFVPDATVVATAPSYLFWRCAPPELRVPLETLRAVRDIAGMTVVVGPHASTTPAATRRKLDADVVIMGECEELLPKLADGWRGGQTSPHAADMSKLPALHWPRETIARHHHHHHRFEAAPKGPGAEMETSRGCPYHCTFCAKDNFRNLFRRRPLDAIGEELDGLVANGIEYVYFIDEIFLAYRDVLEVIRDRHIKFGIQTRIDLWSEPMLDLLGEAGCVSIEAGVESITEEGRRILDKKCKISTDEISARLIYAKQRVPFVQANLLDSKDDDPDDVEAWREHLQVNGVWANKPVPLFPYPGSPDYSRRWGAPDDRAWERAHDFYLGSFDKFSDIQEQRPAPLVQLER